MNHEETQFSRWCFSEKKYQKGKMFTDYRCVQMEISTNLKESIHYILVCSQFLVCFFKVALHFFTRLWDDMRCETKETPATPIVA